MSQLKTVFFFLKTRHPFLWRYNNNTVSSETRCVVTLPESCCWNDLCRRDDLAPLCKRVCGWHPFCFHSPRRPPLCSSTLSPPPPPPPSSSSSALSPDPLPPLRSAESWGRCCCVKPWSSRLRVEAELPRWRPPPGKRLRAGWGGPAPSPARCCIPERRYGDASSWVYWSPSDSAMRSWDQAAKAARIFR